MKEYDRVVLTVNKSKYMKFGLYKGMDGWICEPVLDKYRQNIVNFDQYGPLPDIADYMGIDKEDLRLQEVWELEERAKCIGKIYFPDFDESEYRTDYAVLRVEKEEYGKHDVHMGAYGQIISPMDEGDTLTISFEVKDPKKKVTLTVPKEYLDYCGKPYIIFDD